MLDKAKPIMEQLGAPCIITGKFSARGLCRSVAIRSTSSSVIPPERHDPRPLSAKLLPRRRLRARLIDRENFFPSMARPNEQLRSRNNSDNRFFRSCGGCLLTDSNSRQTPRLFHHTPNVTGTDITLLTIGRHFRAASGAKIISEGRGGKQVASLIRTAPQYHILMPNGFPPGRPD